ncbi:histidinol-phosphate transaminase [Candidatus Symbiopectobacterium sp. 'North America']|uniref:histidinol-phosphate transaminase n=1 Tax=Candidatus Symbiopectobacterium sp. 'North America' TaxID=2794574 RepID=UPI0018C916C3|nr:histidinol-phosphate transaminase [Candidatus Symbiopectobacterium sp. 'North America']MBG6245177.1 histidinol-phosphate transaminase [Candidatus Symbiopectobacterium sp. 'North America']
MHYRPVLDTLRRFDPPQALQDAKGPLINLALNENSLGYSPLVAQALGTALTSASRYPSTFCDALREKLARHHDIDPQRLVFGSGIFEILSLISTVFVSDDDEVVIPTPSFGWYNLTTRLNGGTVVAVPLSEHAIDLSAVLEAITPQTRLIWLCNPHNPIGTMVATGALQAYLANLPADIPVVLDEAYREYAVTAYVPDGIALARQYANLIVLRTFSKAYDLAGLRIGYAVASAETASLLHKVKVPPNVNHLAQIAASAALDDDDFLARSVTLVRDGLADYYACCEALGFDYIPSFANFLMINLERDGDEVAEVFLDAGIVLRSGWEVGLPSWIRVTIGNADENQRVFAILHQLAAQRTA